MHQGASEFIESCQSQDAYWLHAEWTRSPSGKNSKLLAVNHRILIGPGLPDGTLIGRRYPELKMGTNADGYVNHLRVFGKGFGKTFFAKKVFPTTPVAPRPMASSGSGSSRPPETVSELSYLPKS
jgi:hypothetical protein